MNQTLISWTAADHIYYEKSSEWYWTIGIIAATVAALAFLFGNFMFGLFIIVAGFALCIASSRPSRQLKFSINDRGVMIDDRLYSFLNMKAFWIDHNDTVEGAQSVSRPSLLIQLNRPIMPYLHIPIEEVDPEQVREIMLKYIAETEIHESKFYKILEQFGF